MYFVDSHCHLDFKGLSERLPEVLANMSQHRVKRALCVAVNLEDLPGLLSLAQAHDCLDASVGVHPDATPATEPTLEALIAWAETPKVVAIGETGLDFFRLEAEDTRSRLLQTERFRTHVRASRATGKPLIIHTRAAAAETLALMREEGADAVGGVMHCFTETWEVARAALDLGFYISISGIVTFKNAQTVREVAQQVPIDRLLIETDAPYLAPVPHRGKTNEPAWVSLVGACIASLRGLDVAALAEHTSENYFKCFNIMKQDSEVKYEQ